MDTEEQIIVTQTQNWMKHIVQKLDQQVADKFNTSIWSLDKMILTLDSINGIKSFTEYKLKTQPITYKIPKATLLKFKYLDSAFFTSFTTNKSMMPAHQTEFIELLKEAINKY